jgi:hypothetical protein
MVDELKESGCADVQREDRGPDLSLHSRDAVAAFQTLARKGFGPDSLKSELECHFPYSHLAIAWAGIGDLQDVGGEFSVSPIAASPDREVPGLYDGADDDHYELLEDMYIFDDLSWGGSGILVTQRFYPGSARPQIWYLDIYSPPLILDIEYSEYLDNLVITKGVSGWQLLLAAADLAGNLLSFGFREQLQTMLDVFSMVFPGHDYAPLRARLAERS